MSTECGEADLELRAITIREPWLACILHGDKRVENRNTRQRDRNGRPIPPTSHRGLVLLHGSKTTEDIDLIKADERVRRVFRSLAGNGRTAGDVLNLGLIAGYATLADCHFDQRCCGEWATRDQWHLVLADVRRLPEPVPARGSLALPWRVPAHIAEQVCDQVAAAAR